jgi:hypothetical protein
MDADERKKMETGRTPVLRNWMVLRMGVFIFWFLLPFYEGGKTYGNVFNGRRLLLACCDVYFIKKGVKMSVFFTAEAQRRGGRGL